MWNPKSVWGEGFDLFNLFKIETNKQTSKLNNRRSKKRRATVMVRKKFDRTVVKRCPQCEEQVPVACKFCTCGHQFATRNKILLKEEAEEAMGLLDGSASDTKDNSSSENRRRPRRLTRERPNYYVITTELSRHVKKKARQRERNRAGTSGSDNNTPKKKKRGRPRGSGSSASAGTRTRSKTRKLLDHYPNSQPSLGLQIKKEDLGFADTKSSISSSLSYGCVGDKPLTNVTVSICTAPNSCCTANLTNCNVTKHHVGNQGNNSNNSSSSDGASSNSGKDSGSNNQNSATNGHSNIVISNTLNIKNQINNELNSNSCSNITSGNNSSYNNNNNSNNQKDGGGEKDMYSSMSFEKAMKFYAILADLNRKIISQSFKPLWWYQQIIVQSWIQLIYIYIYIYIYMCV